MGGSRRDAETSSAIRSVVPLTNAVRVEVDEEECPSGRDFFQICSVGEEGSSVSFRFFVGGWCRGGGGGGGSSSSESRVRSMISVAW